MNFSTTQLTHSVNEHLNYDPRGAVLYLDRPVPKSQKQTKPMTCFEILDAYTESRTRIANSNLKNIQQNHKIITKVLRFFGFTNLNEIDRAGAECVGHALTYLPKNPEKHSELKGLNGFELIAKNQSLTQPNEYISPETKKSYIHKFSTFLNWAKSHHHVSENVFYNLPTEKIHMEKKRFPFNDKQLIKVFTMEDYESHQYLHPYYYWIPLLLRYGAFRLNEACQMHVEDITVIDGIDCFLVRKMFDGQRIKNNSSIRVVPIHDELLKKGFISFVNSQKSGHLFPELPLVKGYYSNNASKWFARRRKKLGLGKGFDAHSFRHTFINELKQQEYSKEMIECIVGHSHNSESFDTYSYQYDPKILAPIVNMIGTSHTASVRPYNHKITPLNF